MTKHEGHLAPGKSHQRLSQGLTGQDLAAIVRLLQCKLAWYGFRSVKVGPVVRIKGSKILIELFDGGDLLCCIELDSDFSVADSGQIVQQAFSRHSDERITEPCLD